MFNFSSSHSRAETIRCGKLMQKKWLNVRMMSLHSDRFETSLHKNPS